MLSRITVVNSPCEPFSGSKALLCNGNKETLVSAYNVLEISLIGTLKELTMATVMYVIDNEVKHFSKGIVYVNYRIDSLSQ